MLNTKYLQKQMDFYQGKSLPTTPLIFYPNSPYDVEVWKYVDPYILENIPPFAYKVSSFGRVYSEPKAKKYGDGIMCPSRNGRGYLQLTFSGVHKERICVKIGRLVLMHFNFNPYCYELEVDHLDGNKDNNHLSNLEWVTPQENTHRAIINNQRALTIGDQTSNCDFLSNEQAYELYSEAIDMEEVHYGILAKKYNVTTYYIDSLVQGKIRPYIADKYYRRLHIDQSNIPIELPESHHK